MQEKIGNSHHRAKLFKITGEMNLSMSTDRAISSLMNGLSPSMKESMAKEILEIIKDCKTEKEVIQKLQLNTL